MKLFFSPASPFVRKCMVVAHQVGLVDRIEILPSAAHPVNRDASIIPSNPLGRVPTLITDEGTALFDSRVIAEYLDSLGNGSCYPKAGVAGGMARWKVLTEHALADGMMEAAILVRYEAAVRPENLRWPAWTDGQMDKIIVGLREFETKAGSFGERFDIATISLGCLLGYLDFRFTDFDWRAQFPELAAWYKLFSERPAMRATAPG